MPNPRDLNGPNSLPLAGDFRQTGDVTLYAGLRPWQGAEFWVNPEIDQGFGLANTHGAAGFPSGRSLKLGDRLSLYAHPALFSAPDHQPRRRRPRKWTRTSISSSQTVTETGWC